MKERRKYRRVHIQLPLRIHGTDMHGQDVNIISITKNVSTGGAYFEYSEPLEVGMKVNVFLSVPYEIASLLPPKILESEASIVRVAAQEDRYKGQTGIAVKFLKDLTWQKEVYESM